MKNSFSFLIALFILSSGCTQETGKLEDYMNAWASQEKFNGSVLVVHKGKLLLDKGYGYRNFDNNMNHDKNSIFQIGSITKQFTSALILKLQEEGKLKVTDKLSKYFPRYPKADSITIEHLLTHTSGIYSYTNDPVFMVAEVSKPADRNKMMGLFKDKPLEFSPGTKWNYSNSGYSLLGYIIEDVTKLTYDKAVRKYIFRPLQMNNSGFDYTNLKHPNKSVGYFRLTQDDKIEAPVVDSSVSFSAGAIYSTTGDLYKWHESLLQNKIISKASKEKAFTPVKNNYGYGWAMDTIAGKFAVGHSGGIHGFNSNMVSVPGDNTCIILLANVATPNLDKITRGLLAIIYNQPYELPREKIAMTMSEEELKQYTGVFELTPELVITISLENGKLMGKPEKQGALQLHPEKKDLFFIKEVEAEVRFQRNEKGIVEAMTLMQGGQQMTGRKR